MLKQDEKTPEQIKLIKEMKAPWLQLVIDYKSWLSITSIAERSHVVLLDTIYITCELDDTRTTTGKTTWDINPLLAARYTKADATTLAQGLRNGNNVQGFAIGIRAAVTADLDKAEKQVAWLDSL